MVDIVIKSPLRGHRAPYNDTPNSYWDKWDNSHNLSHTPKTMQTLCLPYIRTNEAKFGLRVHAARSVRANHTNWDKLKEPVNPTGTYCAI